MGDFGWVDYLAFTTLIIVSTVIGSYSARTQKKKNSVYQYITAGGTMNEIPVALSLLASFLSSITLVGQPAEVYQYGPALFLLGFAAIPTAIIVGSTIIPFFRKKKYFSSYQYFGERYNRKLQCLCSTIFTVQMILYLATVLYAPALAMAKMGALTTMTVVTIMFGVCIFYTTIGGVRGVILTDSFQVIVIYASMFYILYEGTVEVGGISVVWERNREFNRTDLFNFDWDMTERYTVWAVFFGSSIMFLSNYGANQFQIQRYMIVKSTEAAIRTVWINIFGWITILVLTVYAGLLTFAAYCYCDPLLTNKVKTPDELFPLFIKETIHIPGVQGIFLCALFSAGLSTVSTGFNSLAAIWFAELEGTRFRAKLSEAHSTILIKILSIVFGLVTYFTVFAVPHIGGLVQISMTLSSTMSGTLLAVYILGFYFPKTNGSGVMVGVLLSVSFLAWLAAGNTFSQKSGLRIHPPLPSSTKYCSNNTAINESSLTEKEDAYFLYRISYHWYSTIAIVSTIVGGIVGSWIFKGEERKKQDTKYDEYLILDDRELKPIVIENSNYELSETLKE